MKVHAIFEGGPAAGTMASVIVGLFTDEEVPQQLRLAALKEVDALVEMGRLKVKASVYALVDFSDAPIPGQVFATYRYSHDYNDLPITLLSYLF